VNEKWKIGIVFWKITPENASSGNAFARANALYFATKIGPIKCHNSWTGVQKNSSFSHLFVLEVLLYLCEIKCAKYAAPAVQSFSLRTSSLQSIGRI